MPSRHEEFWSSARYAVIGHSAEMPFPTLTYRALRRRAGTTVYPVDPSRDAVEGDRTWPDLTSLPGAVEAAVLEVPPEETRAWVERIADAGITRVWIHMGCETGAALALAAERGLEVCHGTCAVQYLQGGFPHNLHRFLRTLVGRW